MARRRLRISAGFGSGGRAGLLGSMLPTASTDADQQRALEIQVNTKLEAFKNGQINYAQLEAFVNAQTALTNSATLKASFDASLQSAKAFETTKIENANLDAAKTAAQDYMDGNGSLQTAKEALAAAKEKAQKPDSKTAIDKMLNTVTQTGFNREVKSKVDGYNAGTVKYNDLQTYLKDAVGRTGNTDMQNKITEAMVSARTAENTTVLNTLTKQYSAGQIPIEQLTDGLAKLRDAADQKDPDQVQKINAAIAAGEISEQQSIDYRKYNDWQTHKITDEQAMSYFNGREAVTKDKQSIEALGKYAAAVQVKHDEALKAAAATSASIANRASADAKAALIRTDGENVKLFNEFRDGIFKDARERAGTDPQQISNAYGIMDKYVQALMGNGGTAEGAKQFYDFQKGIGLAAREYTGNTLWKDYQAKKDAELKTVSSNEAKSVKGEDTGAPGMFVAGKLPFKDAMELLHKGTNAAAEVISGPNKGFFSDGQKNEAGVDRNNFLGGMKGRIEFEEQSVAQSKGEYETALRSLYTNADPTKLAAAMNASNAAPAKDASKPQSGSQMRDDATAARLAANAPVTKPTFEQFSAWVGKDIRANGAAAYKSLAGNASGVTDTGISAVKDETTQVDNLVKLSRDSSTGTVLGTKTDASGSSEPDVTGRSATGLGAGYVTYYRDLFLKDAYPNSYEAVVGQDGTDSKRTIFLRDQMFRQPFVASESPAEIGATGYSTIIKDDAGMPKPIEYKPVSPEDVPTISYNGNVLTPEQRAYTASLMALGLSAANATQAADDNMSWWKLTADAVKNGLDKNETFVKGIWDAAAWGRFSGVSDPVGGALDATRNEFGKFKDSIGLWKDSQKFSAEDGAVTNQKYRDLHPDEFPPKEAGSFGKPQPDPAQPDSGPNFDPAHPDGIFNNLAHSWNDLVSFFGGAPAQPAPAQQPTDPGTGADNSQFQTSLFAANQPGFEVNVPQDQTQPPETPHWGPSPVFDSGITKTEGDPTDLASTDTPPLAPLDWNSGWNATGNLGSNS